MNWTAEDLEQFESFLIVMLAEKRPWELTPAGLAQAEKIKAIWFEQNQQIERTLKHHHPGQGQ